MRSLASLRRTGLTAQAVRVAVIVALGSAIILLRVPLQPALGAEAPFLFAWLGLMLAAYFGGFWPTLAVSATAFAVGHWAVTAAGRPPLGPVAVALFLGFALAVAAAGAARTRYRKRAQANTQRIADLQVQMAQVGRLNAAGELAGSIAHELNQPLTAAANYLGALEQMLQRAPEGGKAVGLARRAAAQVARAGEIIAQTRASLQHGEVALREESLAAMVQDALEVAMGAGPRGDLIVRCDFHRADDVLADRIQIQQVILNLVRNAVEAMAGGARQELTIESHPGDGGLLEVRISDTGPGVAPEIAARLFQPFVSSKPQGMGIGLSLCRSIVEAHGGRLWAEENAPRGATFAFTLRRAGLPARERRAEERAGTPDDLGALSPSAAIRTAAP